MTAPAALILSIFLAAIVSSADLHAGEVRAVKIVEPIKVDGLLNEPAWSRSEPIGNFIQFEPRYGEPSSQQTFIRVIYDRRAIYFGIECHDSEPGRISSKVTRRDGEVGEDDSVALIIDTFDDKNNAYSFPGEFSRHPAGREVGRQWPHPGLQMGCRLEIGGSPERHRLDR